MSGNNSSSTPEEENDYQPQSLSAPVTPLQGSASIEETQNADDDGSSLSRSQSRLRQTIREIHANPVLSAAEKARQVQELMSVRTMRTSPEISLSPSPIDTANQAFLNPTYFTSVDGSKHFGCRHYRSNCKVLAECCKTWHPCRFCHDEWAEKASIGHAMNRHAVKMMLCQFCHEIGPVDQYCSKCQKCMAGYYCNVCKLFDDDPEKPIFHCDDCGICRVGKREQFVHCNRCHGCINIAYHSEHRCLEGSLDAACPICGEVMFSSVMPVMFLRCGHAIHSICFLQHSREYYQCPVCCKSFGDMSSFYRNIDKVLAMSRMPPEYESWKAEILCNDCAKRSITKYHFLYYKCNLCEGYNTKLIRTFAADQEESVLLNSPLDPNDLLVGGNSQIQPQSTVPTVNSQNGLYLHNILEGDENEENAVNHASNGGHPPDSHA